MESRGSKSTQRRRSGSAVQPCAGGSETGSGINNAQRQRFIETALELECDEDKERFEEKLGQIAKAKPGEIERKKP